MRYTYELRDRLVHSGKSVLSEMAEALSSHVFLDKGNGPIEKDYDICYLMQSGMAFELAGKSEDEIQAFRRFIYEQKGIPRETKILVFSKEAIHIPVLVQSGRGKFCSFTGKVA